MANMNPYDIEREVNVLERLGGPNSIMADGGEEDGKPYRGFSGNHRQMAPHPNTNRCHIY